MPFYRSPTNIDPLAPIHITSANLTRLANALDARRQDRLNLGAEYRVLANRLRPDIGPSVVRYERPVEKATIDLTDHRPVPGKIDTAGAIDEDTRRADDVARIERGESLEDLPDIRTQMNHVARKAQATEVVIEKLEAEFRIEHAKLSAAYCKPLKPKHDADMKRFFKMLGEAYTVYSEMQKTKRDLVESQIGFGGLFGVNLDFLRSEDVRTAFNEAKAAGYVASIPDLLRV
ncbi:hypothetical protein [Bradyrhizobium erythrophlei]|uniref:Uncharacterized protein n=1 Tax=Bradyrhizobium erythrophlei TaxID=1437360 RepID=A0A1M7TLS4_9BRAD|nr:hypothetical protein [Bradyrhizobium erythrophlei]SHN71573.1 hypothetical protein SAMN05444170_2061 [Bradyrhizobium erythrophlei]